MKNNEQEIIELFLSAGFQKYRKPKREHEIDIDQWDYYLEISPIHVLFYSFNYGYFTICTRNIPVKGLAGGGYEIYTSVMIPKLARTKKIIQETIDFF